MVWRRQFAGTVLLLAIGVWLLPAAGDRDGMVWIFLLLVLAPGIAYLIVDRWPLKADDTASLVASYRLKFYLGMGLTQSPAAFGFGGAFVTGVSWLLWLGGAISLLLLIAHAPTERNLERQERRSRDQGTQASLREALDKRNPD